MSSILREVLTPSDERSPFTPNCYPRHPPQRTRECEPLYQLDTPPIWTNLLHFCATDFAMSWNGRFCGEVKRIETSKGIIRGYARFSSPIDEVREEEAYSTLLRLIRYLATLEVF